MAVDFQRIESYFQSSDLKYFRRMDTLDPVVWLLFFGRDIGISVHSLEGGECILFRSLPIVSLEDVKEENRYKIYEKMLARNDILVVGHYSGSSDVVFETTLPIEDGDVTDDQLGRILCVVSSEVANYGPKLRAIARGEEVSTDENDSMNELMRRLFHGDDETSK